jgi:hypothetical protein
VSKQSRRSSLTNICLLLIGGQILINVENAWVMDWAIQAVGVFVMRAIPGNNGM